MSDEPEPDDRPERTTRLAAFALAVVAPLAVCVGLVPVREDIDRSTAALVLVLPVVVVALVGRGPAAVAAVVAPSSFDVLLTRPYYQLRIHAVEDAEAALILLVVGFLVGQLVSRATRSRVQASVRLAELDGLLTVIEAAATRRDDHDLTERTTATLARLLELRECHWSPGYHGAAHPVLTRDGDIAGAGGTRAGASLPRMGVEVPVTVGRKELGRLVLLPAGSRAVSREERLVVVAVADVLALALSLERARRWKP